MSLPVLPEHASLLAHAWDIYILQVWQVPHDRRINCAIITDDSIDTIM